MLSRNQSTNRPVSSSSKLVNGVCLRVFDRVEDLETSWEDLELQGFSTVYQSLAWCRAWVGSSLPKRRTKVRIIAGYGPDEQLVFVVPWQLRRRWGVDVLEFLTAPLASYGHIVCHPWCHSPAGVDWFAQNFSSILMLAGKHDVIALMDQPFEISGLRHPFAEHFNMLGPNSSLEVKLTAPFEKFVELRRKPETRKNIRWRDAKLAAAGTLAFESDLANNLQRAAADELFHDQGQRLSEAGIRDPFGPEERAFYHELLNQPTAHTQFKLLRLSLDGQGLSSIFAAFHGNSCSDLMTSLAQTPYRKYSPGDLVLRRLMSLCCDKNISVVDLGIGDHEYKRQWADHEIELYHLIRATSYLGLPIAALFYAEQAIRRSIKRRPWIKSMVFQLRRRLLGKPAVRR